MVGGVFSNVADSYDVMNDAMSLGVHRIWKNQFVENIGPLKMRKILNENNEVIQEVPLKCLDVAGGTGDISFRILEKANAALITSLMGFLELKQAYLFDKTIKPKEFKRMEFLFLG